MLFKKSKKSIEDEKLKILQNLPRILRSKICIIITIKSRCCKNYMQKEEEKINIDIIKTRDNSLSLSINRVEWMENYDLRKKTIHIKKENTRYFKIYQD